MHEELQKLQQENENLEKTLTEVKKTSLSKEQMTGMVSRMSNILAQTDKGCFKGVIDRNSRRSFVPSQLNPIPFDKAEETDTLSPRLNNSDSEDDVLLDQSRRISSPEVH
jgi:hypothetical protein